MEISVRTIGEVHSVLMGNFGIELGAGELAELRRLLGVALRKLPPVEPAGQEEQRTRVEEQENLELQFNVGPFFWFLSRGDSEDLFEVLDDLDAGHGAASESGV